MRRLLTYLPLVFLLGFSIPSMAQARSQVDSLTIRFMDVELPLTRLSVYLKNGIQIAHSDSMGIIRIPAYYLRYSCLIAMQEGYKPDTIRNYEPVVFMDPLNATLNETVVSSKITQRILQSSNEYVVDYDFVGDNVLVASYKGSFGGNAKIFLLSNFGDTLALQKLPEEPVSIYKSCVGKYYCVCFNKFYPLTIDSAHITLGKPYDIKYLYAMKQCQLEMGGNLYYKISRPDLFQVTYGYVKEGDTAFHVFLQFSDSVSYRASREEDVLFYTEEEKRKYSPKFDVGYMRDIWDRTSFRIIDAHLFSKDDSILVFDYNRKQARYFNLIGAEVKTTPLSFVSKKSIESSDMLQDNLTDRFFLHAWTRAATQTMNEVSLETGDLDSRSVRLDRPFAQNIKVHNGNIYFLWQDSHHAGTRQLFVQKML